MAQVKMLSPGEALATNIAAASRNYHIKNLV